MLDLLNHLCLTVTDPLLNGLLFLPRDVVFILVAAGTSGLITFSRKWVTHQDWLKRAEEDLQRQAKFLRSAKKRKDKAAIQRHMMIMNHIRLRKLRYEGKPLLVAIVPIALLATWAMNRIAFEPPRPDHPLEVRAYFPRSALDGLTHLVPQPGIQAENGWVQRIREDTLIPPEIAWDRWVKGIGQGFHAALEFVATRVFHAATPAPPLPGGVAVWRIRAQPSPHPYRLTFVRGDTLMVKDILVGHRVYTTQADRQGPGQPIEAIEQVLVPRRLFGIVGGIGPFLPPWLVAYILLACTFVPLFKKAFHIY